jgi:Fe-S oxidoreductase
MFNEKLTKAELENINQRVAAIEALMDIINSDEHLYDVLDNELDNLVDVLDKSIAAKERAKEIASLKRKYKLKVINGDKVL